MALSQNSHEYHAVHLCRMALPKLSETQPSHATAAQLGRLPPPLDHFNVMPRRVDVIGVLFHNVYLLNVPIAHHELVLEPV